MIHPSTTSMPTNQDGLTAAWVEWASSFSPRIFGTLNTGIPLTFDQHVRAHARVAQLYREFGGELPTTVLAVQRNPSRPGYHSHSLVCGREGILEVRRTQIWTQLRHEIGEWCKCGRGGSMCVGEAKIGVENVRPRFEPIRRGREGVTDVTAYCVRYCLREDAENMVTVLPGDSVVERRGPGLPGPLAQAG
jgi:hypothetical protein